MHGRDDSALKAIVRPVLQNKRHISSKIEANGKCVTYLSTLSDQPEIEKKKKNQHLPSEDNIQ